MELVTSRDGTPIAFARSGSGPPLVLVHGGTADHTTTWRFVRSALEERFTVCAMDRRGRGASGDAPAYALAREAEDVAAVVDALGERVNVVGHSYGALCAIEAALLTSGIHKLVLYEGVPIRGADLYPPGLVPRLEVMLDAGDVENALVTMFREVVEMPPDEIALMRAQTAAWERRIANARTLPREMRTESGYRFDSLRFTSMGTPTLLLVGGESPVREMEHARQVAASLPDARIAVLPGQQHAAMYTAPELLIRAVLEFLADDEPAARPAISSA